MKFLICFVMLYQYVYSKGNYDIEVEGNLRIGNEFLNQLKNDITIRALELPKVNEISADDDIPNSRRTDFKVSKEKTEFMVQVAQAGVKEIKYVGRYLERKFALHDELVIKFDYVVKDYDKKLKNYMNYAMAQESKSFIDKEYQLLDIIAASNLLLHNEEKNMLKIIVEDKKYNVTDTDIQIVTEIIHKTRVDHMKQEMDYLCEMLNVCRPYPGFCEYISDLIGVVLKLSDDKLFNLTKNIKQKMNDRMNFFKALIKEDMLKIFALQLGSLIVDLPDIKELLDSLRYIITARYKLMKTSDIELKTRTKAVRILLDIIDNAFNKQTDDLTPITFDTTVKALSQWQSGARNDVDMPIKLLFEHIVGVVRDNFDSTTREEVMTLTEVMWLGQSDDLGFTKLFTEGSASLRNK